MANPMELLICSCNTAYELEGDTLVCPACGCRVEDLSVDGVPMTGREYVNLWDKIFGRTASPPHRGKESE